MATTSTFGRQEAKGLTKEERKVISQLEKLAEQWPSTLWLYSGGGTLYLMRTNDKGEKVMASSGGYSQDYIVDSIGIENDGGDW